MSPRRNLRLLSTLLALAVLPAAAQSTTTTNTVGSISSAPSTIKQLFFDGTTPWSQDDLTAASGLKVGSAITTNDLAAAMARLMATGDFDDVQVVFFEPGVALNLILKVTPSSPEARYQVRFTNFPWWSEAELTDLVHQSVPLFNGSVPQAGDQEDAVTNALEQILLTRQITAKVTSDVAPPSQGHALLYRITSPEIRFGAVHIQGASATMAPTLAKASESLTNRPYRESTLDDLLTPLHDAGYLDAALTDLHRDVVSPTPGHYEVRVTANLTEGELYHVSGINYSLPPALSGAPDPLAGAARPDPVNIAAHQALRAAIANVTSAYRNMGYMDAVVDAVPTLEPSNHEVAYTIVVTPGPQYKISSLKVENLSPDQRKEFDSAWKLLPGTPFDLAYAQSFIHENPSLHTLAGHSLYLATDADQDTHQLALTVRLDQRPAQKPAQKSAKAAGKNTPAPHTREAKPSAKSKKQAAKKEPAKKRATKKSQAKKAPEKKKKKGRSTPTQ